MNTLRTTILASVCLIATLSVDTAIVAQPPIPDATQPKENKLPKADEEAIHKVVVGIEYAWNTHDMLTYGKLLRDDVHWVNVVGMHWRGRDAVMAAHIAYHKTLFKNHHLKTDSVEIRSLQEGSAIAVVTTTNDSFTTPDGQIIPKRQNRLTYVLTKDSDGWKIAHGHNVEVDPVAAQFDPVNSPSSNR